MATKAKHITALDNLIGAVAALGEALEEAKEVIEQIANKSGSGADDEGAGAVSRPGKSAKGAGVSGKGGKPSADADDGGDLDDAADTDPDLDDADEGGEELPPAKSGAKVKPVAGKKPAPAAKKAAGKKAAAEESDDPDLDTVREKLTEVVQHEGLGKSVALAILKKYGAAKSTDLDEQHYAAVVRICQKKLDEADEAGV